MYGIFQPQFFVWFTMKINLKFIGKIYNFHPFSWSWIAHGDVIHYKDHLDDWKETSRDDVSGVEWSDILLDSNHSLEKKTCVIRVDIIWSNYRDVTRIPRPKRENLIGEKSRMVKYNNLAFGQFKTGCSMGFTPCFKQSFKLFPKTNKAIEAQSTMKQTDRPLDLLMYTPQIDTQCPVSSVDCQLSFYRRIRGQSLT